MITEKISNSGVLSGTINASSNLAMGIGSSNSLVGGNINTFTKEIDPTIPDYIKEISKEDIAEWDNNVIVNEEQNKTLVELEELIDVITPKNTAKDELVHITDALNLPTFKNKIDGNVEQETTEGTNYFNALEIPSTNTIIVSDSGKTITIPISTSGNGFKSTSRTLSQLCPNLKVGDEPYLYFTRNLGTTYNNYIYLSIIDNLWYSNAKKTITQEMLDSTVVLYGNNFNNGETEQCILTDFRIVKEENALWEKFTNNQQSPNPDYKQPISVIEGSVGIKVTGKNWLKNMRGTATINGLTFTHNEDDSITVNGTATANTPYYFHSPVYGEALTFSKETLVTCSGITTGGSSTYRLVYNYLLDNVEKSGPIVFTKEISHTFPIGAKIKAYIYVMEGVTLNNVTFYPMIRLASDTDSTYEPYQEQIVPLDLKGNWAGKIKDTNIEDNLVTDKKRFWLDKVLKKRVFDGTEAWRTYRGNLPEDLYCYVIDFVDCKLGFQTSMCTHFTNVNYAWDKVYAKSGMYSDHQTAYAKYFISNIPTLEEWKTYLQEEYDKGTPVTLVYTLAKFNTIYLGELPESIKTFKGINNIQLLANLDTSIEVTYGLDVKKYADDRYLELTNALVSTGANL